MSALLEKSTVPPGAFGAGAFVASPLLLPASTDLSHLARSVRDTCALRAFPRLGAFLSLAFWGDSGYVSRSSSGAAADGAHWSVRGSQPQCRPPCRVSASSQPPELYPALASAFT